MPPSAAPTVSLMADHESNSCDDDEGLHVLVGEFRERDEDDKSNDKMACPPLWGELSILDKNDDHDTTITSRSSFSSMEEDEYAPLLHLEKGDGTKCERRVRFAVPLLHVHRLEYPDCEPQERWYTLQEKEDQRQEQVQAMKLLQELCHFQEGSWSWAEAVAQQHHDTSIRGLEQWASRQVMRDFSHRIQTVRQSVLFRQQRQRHDENNKNDCEAQAVVHDAAPRVLQQSAALARHRAEMDAAHLWEDNHAILVCAEAISLGFSGSQFPLCDMNGDNDHQHQNYLELLVIAIAITAALVVSGMLLFSF